MARGIPSNRGGETDAEGDALRAQAREAAGAAMGKLRELACGAVSEAVRLGAIKELLDRGFGRTAQSDPTGTVVAHFMIDDGYGK